MTDVVRWVLDDGTSSYTFEINPNQMGTTAPTRTIESGPSPMRPGRPAGRAGRPNPVEWSFAGKIFSQAQYDNLLLWFEKRALLQLTDHLGRTFEVVLTEFKPVDLRHPTLERWAYEVSAYILREVTA